MPDGARSSRSIFDFTTTLAHLEPATARNGTLRGGSSVASFYTATLARLPNSALPCDRRDAEECRSVAVLAGYRDASYDPIPSALPANPRHLRPRLQAIRNRLLAGNPGAFFWAVRSGGNALLRPSRAAHPAAFRICPMLSPIRPITRSQQAGSGQAVRDRYPASILCQSRESGFRAAKCGRGSGSRRTCEFILPYTRAQAADPYRRCSISFRAPMRPQRYSEVGSRRRSAIMSAGVVRQFKAACVGWAKRVPTIPSYCMGRWAGRTAPLPPTIPGLERMRLGLVISGVCEVVGAPGR